MPTRHSTPLRTLSGAGRLRASRTSFHLFAERKDAEACSARLHPLVTDLDTPGDTIGLIGNQWSRHLFDGAFHTTPSPAPNRPACSLVFVQSLDGNTGAAAPQTLGGGMTDRHLIYEGLSQVSADAILVGATTAGRGHTVFSTWHPDLTRLRLALGKPRHPVQIVATRRGVDLEAGMLYNLPDLPVILLTGAAGAKAMRPGLLARPWLRLLVVSKPDDLPTAFETMHAWGLRRISSVGGRQLASQLLTSRLVQDVYLTTSALPGGEPGTPLHAAALEGTLVLRKHGTGADTGVVFEHRRLTALAGVHSSV